MKDTKAIELLAEETLGSMDSLQQVDASGFIAARAWNRLAQRPQITREGNYNKVLLRLAAVMVVLAGLNCASFFAAERINKAGDKTTGSQAFANAYNLNNSSHNY